MTIYDRVNTFELLFEELQDTNSRIEKRGCSGNIPEELSRVTRGLDLYT